MLQAVQVADDAEHCRADDGLIERGQQQAEHHAAHHHQELAAVDLGGRGGGGSSGRSRRNMVHKNAISLHNFPR